MEHSDNQIEEPGVPWERKTVEKLLLASIREQRRTRRWKIFFRICFIFLIIFAFLLFQPTRSADGDNRSVPHTGIVDVEGPILPDSPASAGIINKGLDDAFDDEKTKAVLLRINSPGGSPVQAGEVYEHIKFLRKQHPAVKLYAVCTDVCASGAYYIAAAADQIYVDKASLVGSIGVLMNGFGFVDTIKKVGATRRLLTAGNEKGFLDPFSPLKEKDLQYAQTMLDIIHKQFINAVKQGRGKRLKESADIFSGLAWTGEQALPMGLVDGIGTPDFVAREVIGEEKTVNYTAQDNLWQRIASGVGTTMGKSIGSSMASSALHELYNNNQIDG